MAKQPKSAAEVLERLIQFVEDPEEVAQMTPSEIEAILLAEGIANPLPEEHSRRLLIKTIERLRESAAAANDTHALASLAEPTEVIVERILAQRRGNLNDTY
jgi:hypothetical protein